jgi:hypothetical protein
MLTKLKLKLLKAFRNKKLNVFGLFLLLTFFLLVLTKLSKKHTETITLSISYVNVPENRIITLDSLPKINAIISSYGFNLLMYQFKKRSIVVDFNKDVNVKNGNYVWVANKFKYKINKQLGASTEMISINPDTLNFPFETLSVKKVPVILNSNISFKSGYDLIENYTLKPDSVNVIGSVAEVSKIRQAETISLNLNEVSDSINKIVLLKKPTNKKLKFSHKSINVTANIEKFTEGILEIPITIVNKPLDITINYFPKAITVSYYVSLNNYKNIKPTDFKIECDFSDLDISNKTFLNPKLVKIPQSIKNVKMKQNRVEFILMQ